MKIKRDNFESIDAYSESLRECNDCGVIALVVATGESYDDCRMALKRYGRKYRQGVHMPMMVSAAKYLGYTMIPELYLHHQIKKKKGSNITPITATKYLPKRRQYILEMNTHVAGVYRNKVIDWAADRRRPIYKIWSVTKIKGELS